MAAPTGSGRLWERWHDEPEVPANTVAGTRIGAQRRNVIYVAIALGMLVMALGQTSVAPVLPRIVHDIGDAPHQS